VYFCICDLFHILLSIVAHFWIHGTYVRLFAFISTAVLVYGFSLLALDDILTGADVDYTGVDGGCLYRHVRRGQFSCFVLASGYFVSNSGSTSLLAKAVEQ